MRPQPDFYEVFTLTTVAKLLEFCNEKSCFMKTSDAKFKALAGKQLATNAHEFRE